MLEKLVDLQIISRFVDFITKIYVKFFEVGFRCCVSMSFNVSVNSAMILLESCLGLPKWEFPIQIPPFGQPVLFPAYRSPGKKF